MALAACMGALTLAACAGADVPAATSAHGARARAEAAERGAAPGSGADTGRSAAAGRAPETATGRADEPAGATATARAEAGADAAALPVPADPRTAEGDAPHGTGAGGFESVGAPAAVAGPPAAPSPRLPHLHFGERLAPVRAALEAIASGGDSVRILYFGDSNVAFDSLTAPLRDALQARYGDAGHGFVLVTPGHLPYGHRGVILSRQGRWQLDELVRESRGDGRYGLGGVLFRPTTPRASATVQTARRGPTGQRASRVVVYFQRHPRGGTFELRAEDGAARSVSTRDAQIRDDRATLEVPDGPHAFTVRWAGDGELRLYGMALEREARGVIVDSLGIVGARTKRLLGADPGALAEAVRARRPTLIIMGFGANEASDAYEGDAAYAATFREALRALRGGADGAACLVVAPADQAGPPAAAEPRTFPGLARRVAVQREVAREEGCAFFDTFAAMGGAGSVVRWRRSGLASRDLRHLSAAGYARIARWLEAAITGQDAGPP